MWITNGEKENHKAVSKTYKSTESGKNLFAKCQPFMLILQTDSGRKYTRDLKN